MDAGQVVIEPVLDAASMTDDQVLRLTQGIRVNIVRELTKKAAANGGLPGDMEDREALFKQLDGLDKLAISRKRIEADREQSTGVSQAVGLISQLLRQSKSHYGDLPDAADREPPRLDNSVPAPELVFGETEVEPPQLDYNSFVASVKK